jgi:hypothetical protein
MSKKFHSDISFPDDNKIKLGTGEDAEIYVNNDELIIQNTTSDKDIVFNINDGGSTVEAIRIDAENSRIGFFNNSPSKVVSLTGTFQVSGESFFNNFDVTNGSSASRFRDGHVVHFNTNRTANIFTTSDDLYITNGEDDKDVLLRCDDGSGGVATYLRLDGSAKTIEIGVPLNVGEDDTGHDVIFYGATSGKKMQWDESADTLIVDGTLDVNGTANISGALTLEGTTDQILNLKVTDDGPVYHAYLRGTDRHAYVGFGGSSDTFNIANEESAGTIDLRTGGGTVALTLDASQNATFAGDITCGDDLFMPSAGVINFNSGDMTITHSSNKLTISGGTTTINSLELGAADHVIEDGANILDENDNTLFTLASGNVGVGGALTVGGTITTPSDIIHTGDADTKISFSTNSVRITAGNFAAVTHAATGSSIPKRTFAKTGTTDGDVDGDIVYLGGTTSMSVGKIYHFKSDGTWELADADSAATCDGLLGVALGSSSDDDGVLLRGMVTIANDPGAVGDVLFVSTSAGQAIATAPSGNGDIVRVVGYCLDASNGQIWFNPDGTFVEVTA